MPLSELSDKPRKSYPLKVIASLAGVSILALIGAWAHSFSLIPELFRLNRECQEEGYYMAEFEFKMLGFGYSLDKGHYAEAARGIRRLHEQLKSRDGLIKVPRFSSKKQEMDFYLNLQNPRTGAFIDDSHPYCTYDGPTGNVLLHLEALARQTGQPIRLKYPLIYLDEINTVSKLRVYLDEVTRVGWIASKLPQTSFLFARDLLGYCEEDGMLERNNLYHFSHEWKRALLEWFYENQDPETGFWGPKSRSSGRLLTLDLNNTASIVKAFVDNSGNDRYQPFPLRYKTEMFTSTLQAMSEPLPGEDELDDWHEWALKMAKGTALLTRHLWKGASSQDLDRARDLIGNYVKTKCERFYIAEQGAFSYYPGSRQATLDGTSGGIGCFERVGAFSAEKQRFLWGSPENTCTDLGSFDRPYLKAKDFEPISNCKNINSWRFYSSESEPVNHTTDVSGVFYPEATCVPDVMELVPRTRRWIDSTSQSMGNWVSREEIVDRLTSLGIEAVPVSRGRIPLEQLNGILKERGTLTLVGFDLLQVPRCRITFISD